MNFILMKNWIRLLIRSNRSMKKFLLILVAVVLVTGMTGCAQKANQLGGNGVILEKSVVSQQINGWKTYTNPAYRYELRFPTDWDFKDTGEDGKAASFYPIAREKAVSKTGEKYYGSVVIASYSNWTEKYTLEEFYRNQAENLYVGGYKTEEITVGGIKGIMFKDVRNKNEDNREKLVDLIALNLEDRIIEIEVHEKDQWDNVRTLISSIKFYPNNTMSDLKK